MKKLTGKAGKLFRQYLKEGLTEAYAKRKAKGLAAGKTLQQARGHKEEFLRVRKRPRKTKVPKSRIDKTPQEWAAYTYQCFLSASETRNSPFSMSSYDHTKTLFKNYDIEPLFKIHKFFEEQIIKYLKWFLEPVSKGDIYVDTQEDRQYKHRVFEWKLFQEDGELRYWLEYEKGIITKSKVWFDFDINAFKLEIQKAGAWE